MRGFVFEDDPGPAAKGGKEPLRQDEDHGGGSAGLRWQLIVLFLLVVVGALAALGVSARFWKKGVLVREVVVSGNKLLGSGDLDQLTEGFIGVPIENVDEAGLAGRIEALPYILKADVRREMNGIVRIMIEERSPLALVMKGQKVLVMDSHGYILPYRELNSPSMSFRVHGVKTSFAESRREKADEKDLSIVKEMIGALDASDYARLLFRELFLERKNGTYFSVAGSPTVFLVGNDGGYKEKLKKFEIFWQKVLAKQGLDGFEKVDLRFADNVYAIENGSRSLDRVTP